MNEKNNRTASEIARRTVILDNLKKQVNLLVVSGSPLTSTGTSGPSSMQFNSSFDKPRLGSESKTAEVSMNPINTSDRGLIQRQQDVIKLQDEMVLDISKGVDRLHDQVISVEHNGHFLDFDTNTYIFFIQAVAIGEEAKIHMNLLDKLDTQGMRCKTYFFLLNEN